MNKDISKKFRPNAYDSDVAEAIIKLGETPEAMDYFLRRSYFLSDYAYWFILSTLWISCSQFAGADTWRMLFTAKRRRRKQSIMKPSELKEYNNLRWFLTVYRATAPSETDWINYTLDSEVAIRFAKAKGVEKVDVYSACKRDVIALFQRREEAEIIILDQQKAERTTVIYVKD
ncbi:MAG: hypothetical protein EUB_03751 [Eubacterium sp.]|uniref:hypothetical protein n=1 Tax=Eubacterium sp. TaxID=142586 RepID=UPI003025E765